MQPPLWQAALLGRQWWRPDQQLERAAGGFGPQNGNHAAFEGCGRHRQNKSIQSQAAAHFLSCIRDSFGFVETIPIGGSKSSIVVPGRRSRQARPPAVPKGGVGSSRSPKRSPLVAMQRLCSTQRRHESLHYSVDAAVGYLSHKGGKPADSPGPQG